MGIITIAVNDAVEAEFRSWVHTTYGDRKGALGKGVTEAMKSIVAKESAITKTLQLLKEGRHLGLRYTNRSELYTRGGKPLL